MRSLKELKNYSQKVASESPEEEAVLDLSSPLASDEDLRSLGILPESYVQVARELALFGKEIGYFQLAPDVVGGENLIEALQNSMTSKNPYHFAFDRINALQVASFEAEPIGVVKRGGEEEGGVYKLDIGDPSFPKEKLASSFNDFVLLAGKLDEIRGRHEGREAVKEFLIFAQSEFPEANVEAWKTLAEVVLL